MVPSKSLIAAADVMSRVRDAERLGLRPRSGQGRIKDGVTADLAAVNARVLDLARAQSADIRARLQANGIRVIEGTGRPADTRHVRVTTASGDTETLDADVTLIATGVRPRELPEARPDGERILELDADVLPHRPARAVDRLAWCIGLSSPKARRTARRRGRQARPWPRCPVR